MSAGAKLYEVRSHHGTVYAIHDAEGGVFWTERTEQAIRDLAREKKLTISSQGVISRDDLLRLMGQPPALRTKLRTTATEENKPATPAEALPKLKTTRMSTVAPSLKFEPLDVEPAFGPTEDNSVVILKAGGQSTPAPSDAPDALVVNPAASKAFARNVFSRESAAVPNSVEPDLLTGRQDVSHYVNRRPQ